MKARVKYTKIEVIVDLYPYRVEANGGISFKEIGNPNSPIYTQNSIEFIKEN